MWPGVTILVVVGFALYFGALERVLDRLYLTDKAAIVIIAAIILGSFLEITLREEPLISVNIGGAIIPLALVIYILSRVDTGAEVFHTLAATVFTAITIYTVSIVFSDFGHGGTDIIDPMYIFAITGGAFGYIFGRSRRGSFVAGTLGFMLYDSINLYRVLTGSLFTDLRFGGAGAFDSIVIAGVFAVVLAELVGESRERITGGPDAEKGESGEHE
ncbi:MAG: DUF1614 domain-containing protein [Halanaerobiaceae bacterium]